MRNKRSRKLVSVLITLTMLVSLLVPMVGPASAATTYSMTSVNKIPAGFNGAVGSLLITMDGSSMMASGTQKGVFLDLPSSPSNYEVFPVVKDTKGNAVNAYSFATVAGGVYNTQSSIPLNTPIDLSTLAINGVQASVSNGSSVSNAAGLISVTKVSSTELFVAFNKTASQWNAANPGAAPLHSSDSLQISIPLAINVPGGVSGQVNFTVNAQSSSTFTSGTVTVDNVGTGTVTLASESTPTIGSAGGAVGIIDIKEDTPGALIDATSNEALKLMLPPGFKWDYKNASVSLQQMWGDVATVNANIVANLSTSDADRKLLVSVPTKSNGASFIKLFVPVTVDDSTAKAGDITVAVSGNSTTTPSSFIIGRYGDYTVTAKAFSTTDVIAGVQGQDTGKFEVDESIPGSLVNQRTITMTLPDNVKWSQFPTVDTDNSKNQGNLSFAYSLQNDSKTLKVTVTAPTVNNATDPANVVFKNLQVTAAPDFNGDLAIALAGSEGLTGNVTLGKITSPVSITSSETPNVIIGKAGQAVGDITITESAAGYISGTITHSYYDPAGTGLVISDTSSKGDTTLLIKAPAGVTFDSVPSVSVTSGDLQLESNGVSTDTTDAHEGLLIVKVKSSSTQASTLKISGITLSVDRTLPEGALKLSVRGNAVNQTLSAGNATTLTGNVNGQQVTLTSTNGDTSTETDSIFTGHKDVASVAVATCVTPAPDTQKQTTVFKIGDTKYTLNGAEQTLDAAPYIKNDRTYLPIRFVAKAVGVDDSNIMWNADEQSVVMVKGDRVIKLVIGSTTMTINGVAVAMDAAPEVVDPGRTMLPVRWVAQALGANIQWDAATQTVTIN